MGDGCNYTKNESLRRKHDLIDNVQQRLIDKRLKCPSCCVYVSKEFIITWSIACGRVTTLWFDIVIRARVEDEMRNEMQSQWSRDKYDIDLRYELKLRILDINDTHTSLYNPPNNNDSFGKGMSVSMRFLLTVFYSYMLSVFLWQPLILFIKSVSKLRAMSKRPEIL